MSVFDDFTAKDTAVADAAARQERDMREALRLLMTRREGRVLLNWLLEGQDPRAIMRRVMQYVEDTHV